MARVQAEQLLHSIRYVKRLLWSVFRST